MKTVELFIESVTFNIEEFNQYMSNKVDWGHLYDYGKKYLQQSYKDISKRKAYYSKQLTAIKSNPTQYLKAGKAAFSFARGNYLKAATQAAQAYQYWRTPVKPRKRWQYTTPSRGYLYRRRYRSKRLPYWIWLRNKRKRKRQYKRRYTTWNY